MVHQRLNWFVCSCINLISQIKQVLDTKGIYAFTELLEIDSVAKVSLYFQIYFNTICVVTTWISKGNVLFQLIEIVCFRYFYDL